MSAFVLPYWRKVLIHFERKGYIHNGLTIPFLIGSIEELKPGSKYWTIDEMIESLSSHGCTILKCPDIKEFVIGTLDDDSKKNKKLYHCPCDNVLVTDDSLNDMKDLASLKIFFKNLYQPRIERREFSKNGNRWAYFTETDLIRLKEIK